MSRSLLAFALLAAACAGGDADDDATGNEPTDNQPPGAPDVKITPSRPSGADDLELEIVFEAADPDGDPLTYEIVWLRDGEVVDALAGEDRVPDDETERDEEWEVRVRALDPWTAGPSASDEVEIGNTPPTVSPRWTDTPDGDLLVDPNAEDEDGDEVEVSYTWTKNGRDAGVTGRRVESELLVRGDTWEVTVTATDGDDESEPASLSFELPNNPPQALVTFPVSPTACGPLVCQVSASDADGDPVTVAFRWERNGVVWQGTTTTTEQPGDTIPRNEMVVGDDWVCTAVVSDGFDTVRPSVAGTVGGPRVTERFDLPEPQKLDLLLVIDDSGSMAEEQNRLARDADTLLAGMDQSGLDWQIGAVTTDTDTAQAGKLVATRAGRWITPTSTDLGAAFDELVQRGTTGSSDERGRRAAWLALTPPLLTSHNFGFIRPDAHLAILVLSDENDFSANAPSRSDFIQFLRTFKPDPSMVSFHGLIGLPPAGCSTVGGGADPGTEYSAVREAIGGYEASICNSSYAPFLLSVADYLAGKWQYFTLQHAPDGPVTGTVTPPRGQPDPITEGVDFTVVGSVVAFAAPLEAGSVVQLTYDFACE